MSRKRNLHVRNWYRYLWLDLRSLERTYLRERRKLAARWERDRWLLESGYDADGRLAAAMGRLIVTLIRRANSSRELLGL